MTRKDKYYKSNSSKKLEIFRIYSIKVKLNINYLTIAW